VDGIKERAAYLRGLAEGLNVGDGTREGRILREVVSFLSEVAEQIDVMRARQADLEDHIEGLDEDVADLEQLVYDDDDLFDLTCPHCHEEFFDPRLLDEDVDELTCPACGQLVLVDDDEDDEDIDDEDDECGECECDECDEDDEGTEGDGKGTGRH